MAKLERIVLVQFPEYDEAAVENLIRIQEEHNVKGPILKYRASLIDRSKSETQPQYSLFENEDMLIRVQYLADPGLDLGVHQTEEAAIARCQEHHDSIFGA
jgi:hypothetical protein